MKASEVITELQALIEKHGDLPVFAQFECYDIGWDELKFCDGVHLWNHEYTGSGYTGPAFMFDS